MASPCVLNSDFARSRCKPTSKRARVEALQLKVGISLDDQRWCVVSGIDFANSEFLFEEISLGQTRIPRFEGLRDSVVVDIIVLWLLG